MPRRLDLVLAVALALVLPTVARADQTIRFYSSGHVAGLGSWDVGKNPRLGAAVRNFGEPDVRRIVFDGIGCRVAWNGLGLRMVFANLGGQDPCHGQYGYAGSLVIRGDGSRQWRTERGLRIGMREARVPQLHPRAPGMRPAWIR